MTTRKTGRTFQVALLVAILIAANAFLGFMLAQESERALSDQIRSRMMDLACSAAAQLDGDSLEQITSADQGNPAYSKAYATLEAYQNNVDVSYVYCLRKVGEGRFAYIVDPADEPADYGELATHTDALERASTGVPTVDLVAYEDKWGRFYTAYCPVVDSRGDVAGIVAVDFEAAWYEDRVISINGMIVISVVASFVLALIALIVIARMSQTEARHAVDLERANRYDALTDLPNMGHFLELAESAYADMIAKGEEPAMLYLDVVDMGDFNRRYGYAGGNQLLKSLAEHLAKRFGQDRCGRFGQDHFAVLTTADNLEERLGELIDELGHPNGGLPLPVRIGVNLDSQEPGIEASVACDRAKAACESLRGDLGSRFAYFSHEMMEKAERRRHIIGNLDRALAEGWITVNYQPIVRSSTGKVCDEESLARWTDPELGPIPPSEFVPVIEEVGLAYKLDLFVLEQALAKMRRMDDAGLHVVSASVNLSRSDFEACDIVEEVRARVDASGFARDKVNVEITETAMGRDFEFMSQQVERLHELGFQVWMDDFGSEYSSLDYLQSLRFDVLKLDMRFMQQFESGNDKSKIILTELVKMALGLGIDTVAEGVETREQAEFLRKVGCGMMQGFYFCSPKSEAEVLERYATGLAIGFENPSEAEYYSALGRVNLYDLTSVARSDDTGMQGYFNTLPMAVIECTDEGFMILRCNRAYFRFIADDIGDDRVGVPIPYAQADPAGNNRFLKALRECGESGERLTIDEELREGLTVHAFVRRIAVNPVTGASGVAVAVLAVTR